MVATQFSIAVVIVVALVGFYVGLDAVIARGWLPITERGPFGALPNWVFAVAMLFVVLIAASIWGGAAALVGHDDHPDDIAAAHRAGVASVVLDLRIAERGAREPALAAAVTTADAIDLRDPGSATTSEPQPGAVPTPTRPTPPASAPAVVLVEAGPLRTYWLVENPVDGR